MGKPQLDTFEDVYKLYYKRGFYFTKSYVHDDLVAEDIVSEALIKFWDQARRLQLNNPDVFFLTILRNKSLDYLKHEAIKEQTFEELQSVYSEELSLRISMLESCNPTEIFLAEIQEIVQQSLARFSEQTCLIFEMSRFGNKSNKEIADEFGISVKSVEYHISKVLKILRIDLKDYLPFFFFMFAYSH